VKTILLKLAEFLALTLPVAWWWNQMGGRDATWKLFLQVSAPILAQMGVLAFSGSLVKDRLLGMLPFVALMVITPGIPVLRKAIRTAIGLALLYVSYVFLAYWAWYTHDREGVDKYSMSEFFPVQNMVDALPFVLWAIFSREFVAEHLLKYIPATAGAAPAPGSETAAKGKRAGRSARTWGQRRAPRATRLRPRGRPPSRAERRAASSPPARQLSPGLALELHSHCGGGAARIPQNVENHAILARSTRNTDSRSWPFRLRFKIPSRAESGDHRGGLGARARFPPPASQSPSRIRRTVLSRAFGVKGFSRSTTSSASTPCLESESFVKPDM